MGMFDYIDVDEMVVIQGFPPILPLVYQTKSLKNEMKSYSLKEGIKAFRGHDWEVTFRLYVPMGEELFGELLEENEISRETLFWLGDFSEVVNNRWLEYSLTLEGGEIQRIEIVKRRMV